MHGLSFLPDGTVLSAAGDGQVRMHSLRRGATRPFHLHSAAATCVLAVEAGEAGTGLLWPGRRALVRCASFGAHPPAEWPWQAADRPASLSRLPMPAASFLSGSSDGTVRLTDTRVPPQPLREPDSPARGSCLVGELQGGARSGWGCRAVGHGACRSWDVGQALWLTRALHRGCMPFLWWHLLAPSMSRLA